MNKFFLSTRLKEKLPFFLRVPNDYETLTTSKGPGLYSHKLKKWPKSVQVARKTLISQETKGPKKAQIPRSHRPQKRPDSNKPQSQKNAQIPRSHRPTKLAEKRAQRPKEPMILKNTHSPKEVDTFNLKATNINRLSLK